jgi:hypothetical protein
MADNILISNAIPTILSGEKAAKRYWKNFIAILQIF